MFKYGIALIGLASLVAGAPSIGWGQGRPDPAALISAQREAMSRFAILDGVWRGTASITLPSGEKHHLTQTERVGPFLDGSVRIIEGRGYEGDGSVEFNALGIVSFNPESDTYSLRTYAQGRTGDFVITPKENGFQWEIPAGPMTIQYTAVFNDSTWYQVGDRIRPGEEPVRFYEMALTRIEDTSWPAAGVVEPE